MVRSPIRLGRRPDSYWAFLVMDAFETRAEADEIVQDDESVCSVLLKDGKPRYFTAPVDWSDGAIRAVAFEIREGRTMSNTELTALELAEKRA